MSEDTQDQVGSDADDKKVIPAASDKTASAPVSDTSDGSQVDDQSDDASDDGAESDDKARKPPKDRLQKRIDSITRSAREAQREAAELRERLARLEGKAEATEKPTQTASDKPRLEDFPSYDAYQEALTDYKVDQRLKTKDQERQQAERQRSEQSLQRERKERFLESSDAAREKYDDYDDVVFSEDVKITPTVAGLLADTENPGEVAYYLAKNPSEALKLAKLPPSKAAIELGRLEAKLSIPAVKKTSGAPPPAGKVQGGRTTARPANPNSPDAIYAKYVGK